MATIAPTVTPMPGLTDTVVVNSQTSVVTVFPANINGGFITNPLAASDQGLSNPEPLYVNPIGQAHPYAHTSSFALQPGQTWTVIPGQSTPTTATAQSNGHQFSAVYW